MMETGRKTRYMDMALTAGKMAISMSENGQITRFMDKVYIPTAMDDNTKDNMYKV